MRTNLLTAIGLLSAAIIAFQLALMKVFSIVQWYHFAYMVISVALLGFGAAGTFLSLFEKWLTARHERAMPLLCMATAVGMALTVGISQYESIRFDLFLLFSDAAHAWRLPVTYLLFFLPFFTGALAIGLAFTIYIQQIGRVYFANLLGSSAGGVIALALMWLFMPAGLPAMLAMLPFLAGLLILPKKKRSLLPAAAVTVAAITWALIVPPRLHPSEFKDLSKVMLLPDAEIMLEKSSPYGLMQVVSSPVLRHAPGLSLNYTQPVPVRKVVFNNGNWEGTVVPRPPANEPIELDFSTTALPYIIGRPNTVLVPGAGTGESIAHALARNVAQVVAVEPNAVLLSLLINDLAGENDSLFHHPDLTTHSLEPRTWLMSDTASYDLIVLPVVSAFGGGSGVQAMQEQFAMTQEAFAGMWERLAPNGMIAVTCWMDYPVRNPLKLLATLASMLDEKSPGGAAGHLVAVRSWGTVTFVAKKSPVTAEETALVRAFCEEMSFDPLLLPGLLPEERQQYNQLQDSLFFSNVDILLTPGREQLYRQYAFNIRPATDQRPFFSQFLRWRSLPELAAWKGAQSVPFLELGYLIVAITLAQITLAAAVFILLPLVKWRRSKTSVEGIKKSGIFWILLYFGGIGLGFMFLEIVLIQQSVLLFGNPVLAAAAVISGLLVASGTGSYYSGRLIGRPRQLVPLLLLVTALIALFAIALPLLLLTAISLPLVLKILLLCGLTFPLGFLMGIPFPAGLSLVAGRHPLAVPWAWAVNGFFSVISTALATIVAVEFGFSWALVLAAAGYGAAGMAVMISGGGEVER